MIINTYDEHVWNYLDMLTEVETDALLEAEREAEDAYWDEYGEANYWYDQKKNGDML